MKRRDFLKGSAAFAGAATGAFPCVEFAAATPIQAPVVDKLSVRMIVDINTNFFLKPQFLNGVSMVPANRSKDYTRTLHSEFGLSLLLEFGGESQTNTIMLDYAYTPATLLSNFDYLGLTQGKSMRLSSATATSIITAGSSRSSTNIAARCPPT